MDWELNASPLPLSKNKGIKNQTIRTQLIQNAGNWSEIRPKEVLLFFCKYFNNMLLLGQLETRCIAYVLVPSFVADYSNLIFIFV